MRSENKCSPAILALWLGLLGIWGVDWTHHLKRLVDIGVARASQACDRLHFLYVNMITFVDQIAAHMDKLNNAHNQRCAARPLANRHEREQLTLHAHRRLSNTWRANPGAWRGGKAGGSELVDLRRVVC